MSPSNNPQAINTSPFEFEGRRDGGAVGFGFQPKQEEIVGFYLFNKVAGKDDSGMVIPESDLYGKKNPWEIWQEFREDSNYKAFSRDEELYLFTTLKKKDRSPSRYDRRIGLGTWKAEDSPKIIYSVNQRVLGLRRRYRFESTGSEYHGSWIMIEYSLHESLLREIEKPNHVVLCKIKKNQRVRVEEVREQSQLEPTNAFAATPQTDGDGDGGGNENQTLDVSDSRYPEMETLFECELVSPGNDQLLPFRYPPIGDGGHENETDTWDSFWEDISRIGE